MDSSQHMPLLPPSVPERSPRFDIHVDYDGHRRSRKNGDRLRLIPGSRRVQTVFRLTKTEQHLPFIGDEAEA